ncbi:hypothetical protein LAZ67_23000510 [Cordylochernes scorpioides]|uniref:Uncharacterized protein n=1 Tax=Cordylochernes scorpioides TaxID=51811 RepID=A0ABY6LQ29_9ARAC|nr:hypothetical protein LAZ67_23000510 [Cordylochernes scorpioides]
MEYKRCSSCIPGLGALTGYYQPGQLSPEDKACLDTLDVEACNTKCLPDLRWYITSLYYIDMWNF